MAPTEAPLPPFRLDVSIIQTGKPKPIEFTVFADSEDHAKLMVQAMAKARTSVVVPNLDLATLKLLHGAGVQAEGKVLGKIDSINYEFRDAEVVWLITLKPLDGTEKNIVHDFKPVKSVTPPDTSPGAAPAPKLTVRVSCEINGEPYARLFDIDPNDDEGAILRLKYLMKGARMTIQNVLHPTPRCDNANTAQASPAFADVLDIPGQQLKAARLIAERAERLSTGQEVEPDEPPQLQIPSLPARITITVGNPNETPVTAEYVARIDNPKYAAKMFDVAFDQLAEVLADRSRIKITV